MQFNNFHRAGVTTDGGNALHFAPAPFAIIFSQALKITDATADGNNFYPCNLADNLKVHFYPFPPLPVRMFRAARRAAPMLVLSSISFNALSAAARAALRL